MKKSILIMILMIGTLISNSPCEAITLEFVPSVQEVLIGDTFDVDIVISGLGSEALGAFDLTIGFDSAIVGLNNVTFGDQLGLVFGSVQADSLLNPSSLNLFEVSFDLVDTLLNFQADTFTLATLTFDTLAYGTSAIGFSSYLLSNASGLSLSATTQGGSVTVTPEPSTVLLVLIGLTGIVYYARRNVNSRNVS
jgi:hypothetical protein